MRGLARLFFPFLLCLGKIKVAAAAACIKECSSVTGIVVKATSIQFPDNLIINNVTFANGEEAKPSRRNNSLSGFNPGTQYNIYFKNSTEAKPSSSENELCCKYIAKFTVSNITIVDIGTTSLNLSWEVDDSHVSTYTYWIQIETTGASRNESSNTTSALIRDLQPGSFYKFIIYAQVNNTIDGIPATATAYTRPNPVSGINIEYVGTTTVNLTWKVDALNASSYTYRIQIEGNNNASNETVDTTSAIISHLEPGTLYTFSIYPQVDEGKTEGDPKSTSVYTRPSPVSDIKIEYIGTTTLNLTWKNSDPNASNYTYRILVQGNNSATNTTSATTGVSISNLEPGTLYTFSIYPQVDGGKTEGDPENTSVYTRPNPVSGINIEYVGTTTVNLNWEVDALNASSYTYRIQIEGNNNASNETVDTTSAAISHLEPGTSYTFSIYPQVDEGKTEGDPKSISVYTRPNPVSDINIEYVGTTTVNLNWEVDALNASSYTYRIQIEGNNNASNETVATTSAAISHLEPGTSYTFSIYPQVDEGKTEGDPKSTSLYTIPSSVSDISITNVSTTMVKLSWKNLDRASPGYSYRIYISGNINENKTSQTTNAEISNLMPGTTYTFSIYSIASNNKTEGSPSNITQCTVPSPVNELVCNPVPKKAELVLNWTSPNGTYEGFTISFLNRTETLNKEYQFTITNLSYFTNYTVGIKTRSCGNVSLPQKIACFTSITDPPPPSKPPAAWATSHKSLKVQFSSFNSEHGPITAYAVIIARLDGTISTQSLTNTYDDFMQRKAESYVAYVKREQNSSSSSNESQQYDIEIGDGTKTYGYLNGKLHALGTYRASVAGFTRIVYLNESDELINVNKSYVSFSPFSDAVSLPQNPEVIIGAVVGCILVAVLTAAIVGFIFWKKRGNGGKNNDVPFSPIEPKKSKLIKVENFESYFKKQKADSNCGFAEEYEDLRAVGTNQPRFAAELPENKGKNRYNNVLPYDISRVKLSVQNHSNTDYINANYMPGYNSKKEFIAAQGPLPSTVQDFWRMIWEKNIYTIVMLTKCIEQGRTKCEEYWPNKQSKNYGDITVAMTSEIVLPEWTIRDFSMAKSDLLESHPVRQFHFTSWPDHGVPETTDLLISFRHLVKEYMKENPPDSPTLVHCSAGVGRTGTFIAIDRLIQQIETENKVDVYGVVYDLRMHRSLMVQTEDQFVFLNQCVLDFIKSQEEKKPDLIYQNTNALEVYENFNPLPHIRKANGYHA